MAQLGGGFQDLGLIPETHVVGGETWLQVALQLSHSTMVHAHPESMHSQNKIK